MKKLWCCLLLLPIFTFVQSGKLLTGYAYGMIHDGNAGGGIVGNVELLNLIGIGPGAEITTYADHTLIPVFADLKVKHRFKNIDPYITGQFGYPVYSVSRTQEVPTSTGGMEPITYNQSGTLFYGAGAGVAWHFRSIGVFVSYIYRGYKYSYPHNVTVDGQTVDFGNKLASANLFIAGITF